MVKERIFNLITETRKLFYTKGETEEFLEGKADREHFHELFDINGVGDALMGKADLEHNHNGLYPTREEVDALIDNIIGLIDATPRKTTVLELYSNKYEVNTGENAVLSAVLTDSNSNVLVGKTVSFYDNGTLLDTKVTDSNGECSLNIIPLPSNSYTVGFIGDEEFVGVVSEAINITVGLDKTATNISLTADKDTITSGTSVVLTATLVDIEDNPLVGKPVLFYNNDALVNTVVTNGDGQARLTVNPVDGNCYSAGFLGDNSNLDSESNRVHVVVEGQRTPTVFQIFTIAPMTVVSGASVRVTATLRTDGGNPLFNKTVKVYDHDTLLHTTTIKITGLGFDFVPQPNNSIRLVFEGDDSYAPCETESKTVTVRSNIDTNGVLTSDKTTVDSGETATLSVLMKHEGNKLLTNAPVKFYNGTTLLDTKTTNNSGIATLIVTPTNGNNYSVEFEGNVEFNPCVSNFVNITVTNPPTPEYLYFDDMSTDKRSDYVMDSLRGNFVSNPPTITLDKNPSNITANVQKVNASASGEAYYLMKGFSSNSFKYSVTIEKTADFSAFTTVFFNETKDKGVIYQFSGATNTLYMGTMSKKGSAWTLSSIGSNNITLTNGGEYIYELKRENKTVTGTFTQKSNGTVLATKTGSLPSGFNSNVYIGVGLGNFTTGNNNLTKTLIKEVKAEEL